MMEISRRYTLYLELGQDGSDLICEPQERRKGKQDQVYNNEYVVLTNIMRQGAFIIILVLRRLNVNVIPSV